MQAKYFVVILASLIASVLASDLTVDQKVFAVIGTLYTQANSTLQLGTIDPASGKVTSFGPSNDNLLLSEQLTALDYVNEIFYSIALDLTNESLYLVGQDLTTGNMKYQIVLPFSESEFVGTGQGLDVDPNSGDVFVFGRPTQTGPHTLLRVTPASKAISTIITFDGTDILGGVSAYDPNNRIYWIEMASNNSIIYYGIDVVKSVIVWNLNADEYDMETLVWDPVTRLMYGLGLNGNDTFTYRTVVTLNSKTGEFNQIATLEQYFILYAGECAFDWTNRIMYAFLQPQTPENAPFQLVGVNVKSGKIVSNPQVCDNECPWALEFYNKRWH